MVKQNHKPEAHRPKEVTHFERANLSVLRQEPELWYRLHVLLYDLNNVDNDPSSEKRICSTTNELYISEPYFTDSEAIRIRTAAVDSICDNTDIAVDKDTTVEEVIQARLSNFFSKRKASGDARPCGPHDVLPIYLSIFGINKKGLKDDHFLGRLRRSGLGDFRSSEGNIAEYQCIKRDKGKKKDKQDN